MWASPWHIPSSNPTCLSRGLTHPKGTRLRVRFFTEHPSAVNQLLSLNTPPTHFLSPPSRTGYPQGGYPPQPAYGVQPGYQGGAPMYAAPQPTVIIVQQTGGTPWHSSECDICAAPGGLPLCLYVVFCQPCAAGDVAQAAGRDYFCSCFVAPLLSHLAHNEALGDMLQACFWAADRRALVNKYRIHDSIDDGTRCSTAWFMFSCGCSACLLFQELNREYGRGAPSQPARSPAAAPPTPRRPPPTTPRPSFYPLL